MAGQRTGTRRKHTAAHLARVLKVSPRTLERHRQRGMPEPGRSEPLAAWAKRARDWIAERVGQAGRRPRPESAGADEPVEPALIRWRRARAMRAERTEAVEAVRLHRVDECRQRMAEGIAEILSFFDPADVGARIAAQLGERSEPEEIHRLASDEIRVRYDAMLQHIGVRDGKPAPEPPPPRFTPADAPEGLVGKALAQHWLDRWRSVKASSEQRLLDVERGVLHDARQCAADDSLQLVTWRDALLGLPNGIWPNTLRGTPTDRVATKVAADVERVHLVLRRAEDAPDFTDELDRFAQRQLRRRGRH